MSIHGLTYDAWLHVIEDGLLEWIDIQNMCEALEIRVPLTKYVLEEWRWACLMDSLRREEDDEWEEEIADIWAYNHEDYEAARWRRYNDMDRF